MLRTAAILAALASVLQPLLAIGPLTASGPLNALHGPLGNTSFVLALAAAFMAFRWARQSGNKGLLYHGLSLPVLAVIQIAIAEMHLSTMLHIVLGFAYLLAAVSLATLTLRKPHGRAA